MLTSVSLAAVKAAAIAPAAAEYDGFHPPSLDDFFPAGLFFVGTPFEVNRVMLVRIIMTLLLVLVFVLGASRARLVPGRFQSVLELTVGFVRNSISEEILGPVYGKKYAPLLTTIFVGVFFLNISGVIPGLQIASTGVVGMPLVFALVSYVAFIYAGIKTNGLGHYLKGTVMPSGVPAFLAPLIIPIEFLSNLVLRPLTLTIRLMANMISGHLLLALCFVATNALFVYASAELKALGAVTLLVGLAFVVFEIFVAVLQAYIFSLLTAVYLDSSVHMH